MKLFLQCSWMFDTEAWAFSIPTGNFHFVQASVPERLALPASNVAVGSVFNLDFLFFILHVNKELIPLLVNGVSLNILKCPHWFSVLCTTVARLLHFYTASSYIAKSQCQ